MLKAPNTSSIAAWPSDKNRIFDKGKSKTCIVEMTNVSDTNSTTFTSQTMTLKKGSYKRAKT